MAIKRKINIIGEINTEAYQEFVEQLDELECGIGSNGSIEIELSSEGGCAYTALAFYDRIKMSKCDINVTAYGLVASAAVIILAAGKKRRMTESTWVMVHEDTVAIDEHARVSTVEKDVRHARRLEDQWNSIMEYETGIVHAKWAELHKNETYLNPAQCLNLGLATEVISQVAK